MDQRGLFSEVEDVLLPSMLAIEPRKGKFEGGVAPALAEPSEVMNQS